jgi:protein involved in polysaccharide export with SLBB domain
MNVRVWAKKLAILPLLLTAPISVFGQQIDAELLRRIQSQAGAVVADQNSAVDRARERGAQDQQSNERASGPLSEDLQDQLDAARLREKIEQTAPPTPIEKDFRDRTGNKTLRQFGYDLFSGTRSDATQPVTGEVGDSYIMGVGDQLIITFQGATSKSLTTRVDREGRVVVDQIRPIVAAGRTLGAVRRDFENAARATILGTDVYLSIGAVRSVTVLVGGEVNRPGAFNVTSLTDVATVLARAGGVRASGSLRRVRVIRAGQTLTYDLYGMLGIGTPPSLRLRDGDRVVVPAIGQVIALTGGVARPGIYELPPGGSISIGQAVAMAGGPLRPRGNDFVISRISRNGDEQFLTLNTPTARLQAGDAVIVNARVRAAEGRMTLSGFVDSPGFRSISAAPSINALLGGVDNLKPGSYLPMAVLVRSDAVTRARQYRAINLVNVLGRGQNVSLRSDDELVIFSDADISFLQSEPVRRIILGEENKSKCKALIDLESLVRDTQSQRFSAVVRGTFIVDRDGKAEVASGLGSQVQSGIRDADTLSRRNQRVSIPDDQLRIETNKERDDSDLMDEKSRKLDAEMYDVSENMRENPKCPSIFRKNSALMPFLLEHAVSIGGAVRRPGAYPIAGVSDISTLTSVAQGATLDAVKSEVEVTRYSETSAPAVASMINLATVRASDITVQAGDDVRYLLQAQQQEAGAVLLTGEFVRPGLYPIKKGEKLSSLIARAGGLTSGSYPYGAVFTRRSVKAAQQEAFKRSSREMSAAILTLTARRNVSADAIVAAQELANSFATVEAVGRVVVEADPRVLAQRPDLDPTMEAGDAIFMPKQPNFILAVGDVLNPGALQFVPQKPLNNYLKESGGFQRSADEKRVFVVYPNGIAQPTNRSGWRGRGQPVLPPGSTIVIPKNVDPLAKLDLFKDIAQIVGQLAVSFASIAVISNN